MLFQFKSICPKCLGTKKRMKTKVTLDSYGLTLSRTKCYKCGFQKPAQTVVDKALSVTWSPS